MESFARCTTAIAVGLLVSACGSSSPAPPSTGTITGRLLTYGGPSLTPQGRPFAGHVRAAAIKGRAVVVAVPSDGKFVLRLPAGSYSLTGSSPEFGGGQYSCFAQGEVRVTVGKTSNAEVICHEK